MKSKTRIGKKALSLLLSVLMVVTMLPTFAITATADQTLFGNGVMSEYLTDSTKYGFSGTATWDNREKGWRFDGSKYLKLDDAPLSTVTTSTGFAVSFEVKVDTNGEANKFFNFNNGTARISMDCGSGDWWTRYRTEISNGTNTRGYYTSDFTSADFCSKTHTANGNDSYPTGTWYTMTVVMNSDGSYSYYRNGTLLATFKSNYISTGNGGGLTDDSAAASVAGATNYIIGASNTSGSDGFKGYIRNFKIISNVASGTAGSLALLIERYETMMDGTVYKNMAPAYKAYVDACEAYDAVVYGNSNTAQITAAYNALNTAMGNMTAWSAYKGTADMYFGSIATGAYSNVLYAPGEGTGALSFTGSYVGVGYKDWATDKRAWFKGAAPSSVVLYYNGDLSKLYFPVGFEAYGTTNSDSNAYRTINYVDINDDANLELTRYWHGYQQGWNSTYGIHYLNTENNTNGQDKNDGDHCSVGYSSSNTKDHILSKDGSGKNRFWVNIAHIKALSSDNTLSKTSVTFRLKITKSTGNNITNPGSASVSTGIYVVNYYQLTQAINGSQKAYLSQVADYKEGGLVTLLTKYDQATNYEIETTDYSTTASTYYTNAQAHCTTYASELNGVSTPTADSATQYKKLRENIDYYGTPTGLAGSVLSDNKYSVRQLIADNGYVDTDNNGTKDTQLTNYSAFAEAYTNAVGVMAALGTGNKNTNSQSDYTDSTAGTKANALLDAFNALNLEVLKTPTISINNGGGGEYVGKANGVTIASNDGKTSQYSVRTSTDGGANWSNWSEYEDYSAELKPFRDLGDDASKNNWAQYKTRSTDGNNHFSDESAVTTVKFLSRPTWSSDYVSQPNNELASSDTIELASTSDIATGLQYSYNNSNWNNYSGEIAPFTDNEKVSTITVYMRQISGTSVSPVLAVTFNKSVIRPGFSVANNTYLDASHGVEILNDAGNTESGTVTFTYRYDSGTTENYIGKLYPFSGKQDSDGGASVTIYANAVRNGVVSQVSSVTVKYLSRPSVTFGGNALENNAILPSNGAITVTNTSGATDGLMYSIDGSDNGIEIANDGSFSPFTLNSTATKLTVKVWQEKDGSKSPVYTATIYKKPDTPYITPDSNYLDKTHGVTAALNNGTDDTTAVLQYKIDNGEWTPYSGKITPFDGVNDETSSPSATVHIRSIRTIDGITAISAEVSTTVYYLSMPKIRKNSTDIDTRVELREADTVNLVATTSNSYTSNLEFSFDGTHWVDYTAAFAPFTYHDEFVDNRTKLDVTLRARQKNGTGVNTSYSAVKTVRLIRDTTFYIYSFTSGKTPQYSSKEFSNSSVLYVSTSAVDLDEDTITPYGNNSIYEDSIYYKVTVDGVADNNLYHYTVGEGIDVSAGTNGGTQPDLTGASVVKIQAFIVEDDGNGGLQTCREYASQTFFNSANYVDAIMQESFDGATISGTTLTMRGKTANASDDRTATLASAGAASVLEGAGWKDGNGNSPDWRNNVLKINANSTKPGNFVRFDTNPIASPKAAAAVNTYGVTISFWRYLERNGACADLDATGDPTGYAWRNAIAFDDGELNRQGYYLVEVNGTNSVCRTAGIDYYDYVQENQDPTGHAARNNRGNWVNVVITIDPNSGVMLYTNGEPHEMKADYPKKGGTYSGKSNAKIAQDILSLITDSGEKMYFNYGDDIEGNDYDMYLDDIRIYSGVKTQVEINNMYIDSDADVQSDLTSTSHDPTNVTVYTLARDVSYTKVNDSGNAEAEITLAAGTTVGQEVIDYCKLNTAVGAGDISAIDEYSFGTGMTVYKRNKTTRKWEVVGDSQGRCGYQNQDLFHGEYHTALSVPLAYAAEDSERAGAGHLVWAPHVMFNLYKGTWVYYGSTSSWSSQRSAIFVCDGAEGGSIEGPYTYRQIVYKSNGHPNAIDPCVYYGYDGLGKPIMSKVYMAFGSWGGESCIALKTLYADGDGNTYTDAFDGKFLCNGINANLEGVADGDRGSGEGAYVIYDEGYYYLYVSYGQNIGSYVQRVFRSTSPNGGFVGFNGVSATDNTTHATHGGQILAPYDLSNNDYLMVSTGHNSVYKTVNKYGQVVTVNSAHARPYANADHGWKALPDGALATRQSEVTGNVNTVNQVAYTREHWPVLMPFQYDGDDRVKFNEGEITAEVIQGVYGANDLQNTVYYNHADEYVYTIVKDDTDETGMTAFEYGTDGSGAVFKDYIKLIRNNDGTVYAIYYTDKNNMEGSVLYTGVVGMHHGKICISMICTADFEYTWTYKHSELPNVEDVDPLGDSVSMDGVIYTHKSGETYAKYGREISDDFSYGTNDLHQGERCTTITTTYPAKIDLSDPAAIYCMSDEELCKTGEYAGGDFSATALNSNLWFDAAGNTYTDSEAIARGGVGTGGESDKLKRRYGVKGYVSDYYFDASTGKYKDTGVMLIVSYVDVENTANKYSEFEFCYVMANPAMAHTIQGIRNQYQSGQVDMRAGQLLFDRFIGSSGLASNVGSSVVWNDGVSASNEAHSTGTYKYLDSFGSTASTSANYSSPSDTANTFDVFGSTVGVNSGSYGLIEHTNGDEKSYTVSSNVIDTDYYIDYSNKDNYDVNNQYGVITTSNGIPTGYKFRFRTSNIYWNSKTDLRWGTTSYIYRGGDLKTKINVNSSYDSTLDTYSADSSDEWRNTYGNLTPDEMSAKGITDKNFQISGLGSASTNNSSKNTSNNNGLENKYTLGLNTETGRKVMSGYLADTAAYDSLYPSNDYYTAGLERGLPLVDSGKTATNTWNMHIDFTGSQSVNKNTDTTSAEKYANFIIEQGVNVYSWNTYVFGTSRWATAEETYAFYNIGVHTCDKGAARAFAENYLRKRLAVTSNGDGSVKVKRNATTGAPIYLDVHGNETADVNQAAILNPQDYTLLSYNDYIDAVANLNYFVENPTNTTFKDYPAANRNTDTEYTTAYTANGAPIYNTTTKGNNILKNNANTATDEVQAELINKVIEAYENLFREDDYTSAEEAYANIALLDGEDVAQDASHVDTIKITPDEGEVKTFNKDNFTDDSWSAFVNLVTGVSSAFNYKHGEGVDSKDKDSWRHVELSGAEYRMLLQILNNADDSLLKKVDITELSDTYGEKHGNDAVGSATGTVTGGIITSTGKTIEGKTFKAGEQVYTFASWNTLNSKCADAHTLIDSTNQNYAQSQSATVSGSAIVNKGENEPDFNYTQGKYAVTGVTKYKFDNVTFYARQFDSEQLSAEQTLVNTTDTQLGAMSMTVVDNPSCYETYDGAYAVTDTLDIDKYTDNPSENEQEWGGKQILENALTTTESAVYGTLTQAQASAYNAATGANLTAGYKIRLTTDGQTDPQSAALMTAINKVNDTHVDPEDETSDFKYIKYFMITFNKQYADADLALGGEMHKVMYGDPITVKLDANDKVVNWGVSIYDGVYANYDNENGYFVDNEGKEIQPRASQKVSSVYGGSLTRIANNNMAIMAEVEQESAPANKIQYNILDCYGKLTDVMYGTSLTRNGTAVTGNATFDTSYPLVVTDGEKQNEIALKAIPFYEHSGWEITKRSDSLFVIKPTYSVEKRYTITVVDNGETITNELYDTKYTLSVSDTNRENFAAWAVKVGNKYQIASYSEDYSFYVVAAETYVPIVNTGTENAPVYQTADGVPIKASNIDGAITTTGTVDKDEFVTTKIKEHYPFVSLQTATMTNKQTIEGVEKYTKAKAYVRITEGSDSKLSSYGVLYYAGENDETGMVIDGDKVYRRAVTNKLTTGQFTYTLSSSKGFKVKVTFRGYVNYNFEYSAGNTGTATINGLDYSGVITTAETV